MTTPAEARAEGHFSVVDPSPFTVDAEPGLVVCVHSGCLWLPLGEAGDGQPLGAGARIVVPNGGTLTVRGAARTHVELQRPGALALSA